MVLPFVWAAVFCIACPCRRPQYTVLQIAETNNSSVMMGRIYTLSLCSICMYIVTISRVCGYKLSRALPSYCSHDIYTLVRASVLTRLFAVSAVMALLLCHTWISIETCGKQRNRQHDCNKCMQMAVSSLVSTRCSPSGLCASRCNGPCSMHRHTDIIRR